KRRCKRTTVQLPIKVYGTDKTGKPYFETAHTIDLTRDGARIGGLRVRVARGDWLGINHAGNKARFRVNWVGQPGTDTDGQIGVALWETERNKEIWNMVLESLPDDYGTPAETKAAAPPPPEPEPEPAPAPEPPSEAKIAAAASPEPEIPVTPPEE